MGAQGRGVERRSRWASTLTPYQHHPLVEARRATTDASGAHALAAEYAAVAEASVRRLHRLARIEPDPVVARTITGTAAEVWRVSRIYPGAPARQWAAATLWDIVAVAEQKFGTDRIEVVIEITEYTRRDGY